MSIHGLTQEQIITFTALAKPVTYCYAAGAALVVYDSLILFRREVDHIYKGSQSLVKWIYVLIKLTGFFIFLLNFFGTYICQFTSDQRCLVKAWLGGFAFEIIYTLIIRILLVLRLRALYNNDPKVTVLIVLTMAVELLGTTYNYAMVGYNITKYSMPNAPIPGCPMLPTNQLVHFHSPTVVWASRLACNTLELMLMFYGLLRNLQETDDSVRDGIIRIKQLTPFLYVFYRDGTIFYIPVWAFTLFGMVAAETNFTARLTCANWEAWIAIVYYISGTRLILNVRSAGCKFTKSMMTQPLSTLHFENGETEETNSSGTINLSNSKGKEKQSVE